MSNTSTSRADNISKLFLQDFDFVEESFEALKLKASQVIAEVREARHKYQELMLLPQGARGRESQLKELRKKVSKLKFDIPFKLIAPPEQPHPNVNWRPRPTPDQLTEISLLDLLTRKAEPSLPRPSPSGKRGFSYVTEGLKMFHSCCLFPFLEFPPNAIIKTSLLSGWISASWFVPLHFSEVDSFDFFKNFNQAMDDIIEKGLVEAIKKKASLAVAGYRMNHSTRYALTHYYTWPDIFKLQIRRMCLGPSSNKEEEEDNDIFYTGSSREFPPGEYFDILHLGKWKKSSPQHIEFIDNPDLFFKDFSYLRRLEYISLRGISMIQELPKFITHSNNLKILDLQACYNLEVIPSGIANLRYSLKRLDMSECYFLENMPKALATLEKLEVLKGFFVGEPVNEKSCTLEDLLPLQELVKLNIYTSMKEFPNTSQLRVLQNYPVLRSLTISWGGCKSSPEERHGAFHAGNVEDRPPTTKPDNLRVKSSERVETFLFNIEKLDLQCVPVTVTRVWLNPTNFRLLKRLYIRGGQFHDLGHLSEQRQWNVEILRLKHLRKLNMDWSELHRLFPILICLENVDCPNLDGFPCDEDGIWMKNAGSNPATSL